MVCNHRFDSHIKKFFYYNIGNVVVSSIFVTHIFFMDFIVESIHGIKCSLNYENLCFINIKTTHN